ncbi:hypothetical protein PSTT_02802 [Puccinia striiformis]|uniref:Uncharacterized protein n=1 Tax=Puccinia striiformis TaxID=27350 RepID=A0A2S4VYQ0_9BASI|nr:hypothetical protein PSTT_02802 [Puccinia striiformis]
MASSPTWERTETDPSQGFVPSRLQNDPIGGRSQVGLEAAAGRLRGAWRPASKSTSRRKREAASRSSSIQWVRDGLKPFHPVDLRPSACTRGVGSCKLLGL